MTTKAIRVWYAMTVTFAVTVAFAAASVLYANERAERSERRAEQIDRESNRRWCALLATYDDAYQDSPPVTDTGRTLATEVSRLRTQFGCD
ncbi:hypothetical protein AB0C42_24115 [Micromonospora taraxaci]|uniref:hypothetical protein n=1 Tax=Micromonospora taraxaci TaxID=1316803 RepID=UPI0033E35F10